MCHGPSQWGLWGHWPRREWRDLFRRVQEMSPVFQSGGNSFWDFLSESKSHGFGQISIAWTWRCFIFVLGAPFEFWPRGIPLCRLINVDSWLVNHPYEEFYDNRSVCCWWACVSKVAFLVSRLNTGPRRDVRTSGVEEVLQAKSEEFVVTSFY